MPVLSIDFNTLTVADPYVIGSAPDNLTGYSVVAGANNGKIYSAAPKRWGLSSGANAMWRNNTPLVGSVIKCTFTLLSPVSSNAAGCAFVNDSNDGLMLITGTGTNNFRIFAVVDGQLSGSALLGVAIAPIANATIEFRRTFTGTNYEYEIFQNGSKIGPTYTNNTYNTAMYGATVSRGGDIATFSVEYTAAQTITSINSGNPVTVGQTGVVINHTGFTGAATAVTTNRAGVTCTITAGDANSTTVSVSGWVDGAPYPVVDNTVTFTVSRSGESASATQTLTRPANWAQQTFSGAILDDPNLIGFNLAAAGHTVNGGTFYYRTNQVSSLTVNPDTSWASAPAGGTFDAVFIPSAGATAGNAYLFEITVLNGSIVSVSGGLTSIGLTAIGLGVIGLTEVGL
jgi:hypothetical protein